MSIRHYRRRLAILNRIIRPWLRPHLVDQGGSVENIKGGVVLGNYSSWLDHLLLAGTVGYELAQQEQPFHIAINNRHSHHWSSRLTRFFAPTCEYDPGKSDADANQKLTALLEAGEETVLMLPETRPTNTGALLPVADVLGNILAQTNPTLYPLYIHGPLHAPFTACKPRQFKRHLLPDINISLFPSVHLALKDDSKRRERTRIVAGQVYDLLSGMAYAQFDHQRTVFETLLDTAKQQGMNHIIAEDVERRPLSYRKVITGAYALGSVLAKHIHRKQEPVAGLLMPNVSAGLLAFLGLQAYGIAPAILNFTAGRSNMLHACKVAKVQTVVTSRRFIKMAELEDAVNAIKQAGIRILLLEELKNEITLPRKLKALWRSFRGARAYEALHERQPSAFDADRPAVILFTSGSEGKPKGVALTHANLLTNIAQLRARIDFGLQDCIFNPLPLFHTSGLTGGILLPLLSGMKMFLYPSPLHYQTIPELIADVDATVLFATDTFLAGYARYARPHDLHRLRYVFAGAEKLKPETRTMWADLFGVRIFEGYGVTETAPVIAFNTPNHSQAGSVGRFAPGLDYQLEPVEGIDEGGRLWVQGANVMAGYLLGDNPGKLVRPKDGWHDTGDIVRVDDDGFVHILGRAKRFAKIGGEMVSLGGVEGAVKRLWPEHDHAVINLPDKRKGELLVLMTTCEDASREALSSFFRDEGLPELYIPRQIVKVNELPLLGSGKTDYPEVQRQVLAETGLEKSLSA